MKIAVLVKHAHVANFRPSLSPDGKGVAPQTAKEMNDWDRYAVEESLKINQQTGGEVVAISVGTDCERTLRTALAMGATRAIRIPCDVVDPGQIAGAVSEVIADDEFDLILTGYQSQDMNNALVGPLLAGMLDLPYATAVMSTEVQDSSIRVTRELERGYSEEDTLQLPCLLTIQTGGNTPRYASFKGIKEAKKKELVEITPEMPNASFGIKQIYFPSFSKSEMLEGAAPDVCGKLIEIIKEKGVL